MRSRPPILRALFAAAFGIALVSAGPARADGRTDFEKARASFLARNWADAEERLRALLDPRSGFKERSLISQARMYLGAALIAQGKKEDARDAFEKLVLDDPTFEPDPLSFPGPAINTFIDVRSSLLEQIRNAQQTAARLATERKAKDDAEREAQRVWLEQVKAQAGEEKITVRHSRIVASIPFGVGQLQNDQPALGFAFLGAEVAALAGTVVTYAMFRYARDRESDELLGTQGLAPQWHDRAEEIRIVNLGFVGAFLGVAAIGILQANIAYVPESFEKRKRELPPLSGGHTTGRSRPEMSTFAPVVTPLTSPGGGLSGVYLGVTGLRF